MADLQQNVDVCTYFKNSSWIGKNENDLIINVFFMAVISTLFIHATIFIFPQVSDRLYIDILKKKMNVISKLLKLEFNYDLKDTLKKSFSSDNYKKVSKARNKKNRKTIFKKIAAFRILTYVLLAACLFVIVMKWKKCKNLILDGSHLFIIMIMILSFSTEIFIFLFVFSKYIYMPNIKMFSIIIDQFMKILKSNEYFNGKHLKLDLDSAKEKAKELENTVKNEMKDIENTTSKLKDDVIKKVNDSKEWSKNEKDKLIKTINETTENKMEAIDAKIQIAQQFLANKQKQIDREQTKLEEKLKNMNIHLDKKDKSETKDDAEEDTEEDTESESENIKDEHTTVSKKHKEKPVKNVFCPL